MLDASNPTTVAWSARMPKIVRMNLLRRYPITCTLMALVLVSALAPLPPLVDAVSGAPPYDADLVRPAAYTLLAPLSDVLDTLTFLSIGRAWAFLLVWAIGLAVWGLGGSVAARRRRGRGAGGPLAARGSRALARRPGVRCLLCHRPQRHLRPVDRPTHPPPAGGRMERVRPARRGARPGQPDRPCRVQPGHARHARPVRRAAPSGG